PIACFLSAEALPTQNLTPDRLNNKAQDLTPCSFLSCLGFHDRYHEVTGITQQVIGAFRVSPTCFFSYWNDPAIREAFLLADLVVAPTCFIEFGQNVFSAGVSFSNHGSTTRVVRTKVRNGLIYNTGERREATGNRKKDMIVSPGS
ncbi:MAG: hypothetical protein AABZ09_07285, partial [Candidatus Binatota bacterium]